MPGASSSFLLLLVRHLLLEAMHLFLVASLLLVAMPFAPSSVLAQGILLSAKTLIWAIALLMVLMPPGGDGCATEEARQTNQVGIAEGGEDWLV